jgi:hypothetical protein
MPFVILEYALRYQQRGEHGFGSLGRVASCAKPFDLSLLPGNDPLASLHIMSRHGQLRFEMIFHGTEPFSAMGRTPEHRIWPHHGPREMTDWAPNCVARRSLLTGRCQRTDGSMQPSKI